MKCYCDCLLSVPAALAAARAATLRQHLLAHHEATPPTGVLPCSHSVEFCASAEGVEFLGVLLHLIMYSADEILK